MKSQPIRNDDTKYKINKVFSLWHEKTVVEKSLKNDITWLKLIRIY